MTPIHRLAHLHSLYKLFLDTSVLAEVNIVLSFIHCFHLMLGFGAFTETRLATTCGRDWIWEALLLFLR